MGALGFGSAGFAAAGFESAALPLDSDFEDVASDDFPSAAFDSPADLESPAELESPPLPVLSDEPDDPPPPSPFDADIRAAI